MIYRQNIEKPLVFIFKQFKHKYHEIINIYTLKIRFKDDNKFNNE